MSVTFHIEKETLYIQKSQGKRKKGKEKKNVILPAKLSQGSKDREFFFPSPIITDSLT